MYNEQFSSIKKILALAGIILMILLGLWIANLIIHAGKIKVSIKVIPADAALTIDGNPTKPGTVYLKPGKHEFIAKKDGFKDASQTVIISKDNTSVGLTPGPNSDAAFQWLKDNPQIQQQREALAGQADQQQGQTIQAETPLIALLPLTDIAGPYSIDYGPSPTRKNGSIILISDSSPRGRVNALKWIRQQGYDPTDLEIQYGGFNNPILGEGQ